MSTTETTKSKIPMSIRVDKEVFEFFKGLGRGYQTRMNEVLKDFVDHQKAARKSAAEQWRDENHAAIEAHNEDVQNNGVWSDGLRRW